MTGEEGFLARWSRRKRAAAVRAPSAAPPEPGSPSPAAAPRDAGATGPAAAAAAGDPARPSDPRAAAAPGPVPPSVPEGAAAGAVPPPSSAAFDPATLPPVESLTAESDIRAFLRAEVPEALRRAALRRIWTLDPAIRDFVGPADYAWDFNAPDGVTGFAPTLGGDAQRLLAQALGLGRDGTAPPEPGEATPADGSGDAPAPPSPIPGGDAAGGEDEPAPAAAASAESTVAPPEAGTADAMAPGAGTVAARAGDATGQARPRHGGAVPV